MQYNYFIAIITITIANITHNFGLVIKLALKFQKQIINNAIYNDYCKQNKLKVERDDIPHFVVSHFKLT